MPNNITKGIIFLIFMIFSSATFVIAQPADGENEFSLATANPHTLGGDTLTSDAGRGMWVAQNPDLDNDGLPELIVTEYTKGGRVFVYEMVGDNQLEFVWASPALDPVRAGGGSTPRMVTSGDFDNNGMQEIIFPVGYSSTDSLDVANRGIYFYEFTGTDNDYGTEPAFKLTYESIDSAFAVISTGRTENGIRVQDIDGDGKSELLFPPRSFDFSVAKLYILEVESGTFSGGDANIVNEYTYEGMVQPPATFPDGYVPVGTEIGDVDADGFDEIIVAGWTNLSQGAGIGFIQIDGEDTYTPGSVVPLATFNAFNVKAKPIFTTVNGAPAVYLHGGAGADARMWVIEGLFSDAFVTESDIKEIFVGDIGIYSTWAMGDQDHPTSSSGDGLDFYIGNGGRVLDVEYDGSGDITLPGSYTVKQIYNLSDVYTSIGGLFNDFFAAPGMDLDNDGLRDFVGAYKGSTIDSTVNADGDTISLARDGYHLYFFEWGDSTMSDPLAVKPFEIITPDNYELSQNYPNPFNPTTSIAFTLPINKKVSLTIYNTLGQEVRSLINNEEYSAGSHTLQWDARDNNGQKVASGVYIYQLKFGNFAKSMRMTLVR
ncbi:MAG: VCBS repeat-containing protein [Calditrichaeota bacterium]|nr:VCBS repeat-containing protein [Calditrichota bacterium]